MKRFVFCVLCGILCAFEARTEVLTVIDDIRYSLDEQSKTAAVKSYTLYSSQKKIVIPETVSYLDETYAVIAIADYAFTSCQSLLSVEAPFVTSVGVSAFGSCGKLTSVLLSNAATIANNAFHDCPALLDVSLPFATKIDERAFYNCTSLTSVSIPVVISMGINVFLQCSSLESLRLNAKFEEEWLVIRGDYGVYEKTKVSFYKLLLEDEVKRATWEAKYVNMPIVGGEVVSEKDYLIACKAYGLTPLQKPDDVQVLPSGCIAVTKESIAAPSAGTVKVEENKVQLGVTVLKTDDLTDEKKDWDEVTLTADDVKVVDGKIVISVPVDSASGFMVIKTKDAKIETND